MFKKDPSNRMNSSDVLDKLKGFNKYMLFLIV